MKVRLGTVDNSRQVMILVVILLLVGGGYYYFFRIPMLEEERAKLLTLNTEAEPSDLDPALAIETDSLMVIANVFDGLVKFKHGSTEIEPCLATSWEQIDPRNFIFYLNDSVTFHDGTPFNADSVKFSFDRVREIYGAPSYLFDVINRTEVIDSYTVKLYLNWDFSALPSILASSVASIVSPTAVEEYGNDFNEHPIGTGPFKYDSWIYGDELVLTRNDDYFAGKPILKKIVFKSILEATARKTALIDEEVDVVVTGRILTEDLPELEEDSNINVFQGPGLMIEYLGFNMLNPPLNDSRVREAISYAIDYDEIIRVALDDFGKRVAGPIPNGILGYKEDLPLIERDLDKAKQLLEEAGYPDGFSITLTYNIESVERRQVAELISKNLEDVDIIVSIKGLDWDSALDEYFMMGHEMMLNTWFPDYFDPDSYLLPQFHSGSLAPYGANIFGLNRTDLDYLIEEGLLTTDIDDRIQIYGEAQEIICEEMPCVFLYAPIQYEAVRFNVKNWEYNPTNMIEFSDIYKE